MSDGTGSIKEMAQKILIEGEAPEKKEPEVPALAEDQVTRFPRLEQRHVSILRDRLGRGDFRRIEDKMEEAARIAVTFLKSDRSPATVARTLSESDSSSPMDELTDIMLAWLGQKFDGDQL